MTDQQASAEDSAPPRSTVSVGGYLAARLRELGVRHVFGLPGDYNLTLLDELLAGGLEWVGSANELNAAYAADAAARVHRGPAALCTTFGVGELSALNGIAGAYAEDVPLISIVGAPTRAAQASRTMLHHTLVDGDYGHFNRAMSEVTVALTTLTPADATTEIDRVLQAALSASKPVSICVPADVAATPIAAAALSMPLGARPVDLDLLDRFRESLRRRLADARSLTVLVGHQVHRSRLEPEVVSLAEIPGVRIASQPGSKGVIDESHPASLGTYLGGVTTSETTRRAVDDAQPLVLLGAALTDLLTGGFSHRFDPAEAIKLGPERARIGDLVFPHVRMADSLAALREVATSLSMPPGPTRTVPETIVGPAADSELTQTSFWAAVQRWLPSDSYLVADTGTAILGALDLRLPPRSDLIAQPIWASIGYSIPAVLGAGLADPSRRCICIVGDGAAQLTVQELGVILGRGLTPIVIVLDNAGYTVERVIQSPDAAYQDVMGWDWTALPGVLAPGVDVGSASVRSSGELDAALQNASAHPERAAVIRAILPRDDVPLLLDRISSSFASANRPT